MSGIISFLLSCAFLAFCLLVGFFVLQVLYVIVVVAFTGAWTAIAWVWQKLTKRDWPNEPRI